jgi:mannose-6-phosphate isomerase-like protein (cupin superfamily)
MIKKSSEMLKELKDQMRGGKGTIEITHIMNQTDLKGQARMFAKITIEPGCSIGYHEHAKEEEIYYIIKGKGVVNDNGSIYEMNIGDSVITGNGASHSIENTGKETLELLAVILVY